MDDKKPKHEVMTTDAGRPVGDNQNSLTVGPRGPVVFEDFLLFEKMAHFNRERIPERVVHARNHEIHPGETFLSSRQEDAYLYSLFDGRRRERLGRYRTRPARFRPEVLH